MAWYAIFLSSVQRVCGKSSDLPHFWTEYGRIKDVVSDIPSCLETFLSIGDRATVMFSGL